jgi:signal transduction histidine kinase
MKKKLIRWSHRYAAALQKHLKQGPHTGLQPALRLGSEAVALGLETLDLARVHEQALVTLGLSSAKNAFGRMAGIFFAEANAPIEETHRAAREHKVHLGLLAARLGRRTEELAISKRLLQRGVVRRNVMEDVFANSGKRHHKCLEESLELQKRLRHLTHQVIAAQEDERRKISLELQDEIAQTLVGINVRLLALKHGAGGNIKALKDQITSTQRLVLSSARSVREFARELKHATLQPSPQH